MPEQLAALVLDGNLRAAVVAVRCLARSGRSVGVLDSRPGRPFVGAASRYPVVRGGLPDLEADEAEHVRALLDLLDAHPAEMLLPVGDGSVAVMRRYRDTLASRTALALGSEEALAVATDKHATLAAARNAGLAVPLSRTVSTEADLEDAIRSIALPAVVKPATSWPASGAHTGRLTCIPARDAGELRTAVRSVLAKGTAALVQQWVTGRREAVHVFHARGRLWAAVCVVTHRTASVVSGNSTDRVTVPLPPDSAAAATRLVEHLGLEGYAEVEFRRDHDGRPLLMEVNPRLSASVEAATRAGVPFPVLQHQWATGASLQAHEGYRTGVRLRWLGGELRWVRDTTRARGCPGVPTPLRAVGTVVAATVRPAAYDYLDLRDPWPAVRAVGNLLTRRKTPDTTPDRDEEVVGT
ncbi:ATP-grasp domain-containing protein [Geodermatophilus amargosae]|uniref:ATP-grasp domain-containing protein n=1 Tax=Geodermatophilus amargosae TaxID=1296565 RepID=A0A1I6X6B0_9ACTN|nr:ATP-grasp domain-containing protein [Geodermatophilus amargosae]SFT33825.1 ATP-grasp domain-containing protein [Geodermatophilus amargosae]